MGANVPKRNKDGNTVLTFIKSYHDTSKSFTTPDFSDRSSWFGHYTRITDETLSTVDNLTYQSDRVPQEGWNHSWLNYFVVPNHVRQADGANMKVVVKKNDIIITDGFTIDRDNGRVTFDVANDVSDVIKVSYSYALSSCFDLQATAGKRLLLDYVEVQFTEGSALPEGEALLFQSFYNGPAIPANVLGAGHPGLPADTDILLKTYEYWSYRDFLNESTKAISCKKFMGMTKEAIILPWDYLTGHTIVPIGQPANLLIGEFHKLRCTLLNNKEIENSELATGTFYCRIDDWETV